ncbi:polysaccharide pyruvyl transferase family protein [Modestobacter sp. VKM Ac-2978]|uniref:polysaccharide pyruvyl transferase family protein n=1 Tax=Modestobacter sp. VKM Ac-2978 TaxID=3004132 RepID=UPI0022AA52B5|nr:polysaccharide pyruvyl transferase family protein [Modestobacter sp. VKM Ac-2978]MCZ2850075.1 polysaccharide pyruvyl transferase family protein [Modestobacter sp. VKM Ac-2978]
MRVLVTGWFSFDEVIATIGDELGADAVVGWLTEAGIDHDVAWAPYLQRGANWRDLDPADYTHLVFVSGPLSDTPLLRELTAAFADAQRWAVNVSVVSDAGRGLFHRVWERDAPGIARPDLAIGTTTPDVPVVAVAFAPPQEEYGDRSRAAQVRAAIESWLGARAIPWFELTMDLYEKPHERFPLQVEALVRRADVVVSMRLHALVLGLAHGVPVIACDAIGGGAKVSAQAAALGWPVVLPAEQVDANALDAALEHALSGTLTQELAEARRRGAAGNAAAREWFLRELAGG